MSLTEWRLTGAYLFGFASLTFLLAETEQHHGGHHVQCCAKHTRGAWLVGNNEVQGGWKQAGQEAGFTARVNVKHGLPHKLHTGRICDILYTPTD